MAFIPDIYTGIVMVLFVVGIFFWFAGIVSWFLMMSRGVRLSKYLKQHYPNIKRWSLNNLGDIANPKIVFGQGVSLYKMPFKFGSIASVEEWLSFFMDVKSIKTKTDATALQLFGQQRAAVSWFIRFIVLFIASIVLVSIIAWLSGVGG